MYKRMLRNRSFQSFVCLALASLSSISAQAEQFEDNLPAEIHGFFTAGMAKGTNEISYRNGIRERPNFIYDSNFGLNISKRFNSQWDLAAQYLTVFASTGKIFDIDWVVASYYPVKGLTLQAGKLKIPMSLISEHDHVGKLFPWIRPPQEVYALDPVQRFQGAKLTYEQDFGPTNVQATIYGGGISGSILREKGSIVNEIKFNGYNLNGAGLTVETDPVLLRLCYTRTLTSLSGTNFSLDRVSISYFTAGLKIETSKFLVYSEYIKALSEIDKGEIAAANQALRSAKTATQIAAATVQAHVANSKIENNDGYYVTVGYNIINDLMVMFTHAEIKNETPQKSIFYDQQFSNILGFKYDIGNFADVKIEAQRVHVPTGSSGLYTYDTTVMSTSALSRDFNVYSLALDFIF